MQFSILLNWLVFSSLRMVMLSDECHKTWWLVNIGSGNGLVQSGNKLLTEPVLSKIPNAIWRHKAPMSKNLEWNKIWYTSYLRRVCTILVCDPAIQTLYHIDKVPWVVTWYRYCIVLTSKNWICKIKTHFLKLRQCHDIFTSLLCFVLFYITRTWWGVISCHWWIFLTNGKRCGALAFLR